MKRNCIGWVYSITMCWCNRIILKRFLSCQNYLEKTSPARIFLKRPLLPEFKAIAWPWLLAQQHGHHQQLLLQHQWSSFTSENSSIQRLVQHHGHRDQLWQELAPWSATLPPSATPCSTSKSAFITSLFKNSNNNVNIIDSFFNILLHIMSRGLFRRL